ncbi:isoflavone reductase-like protein P3 [Cladorrhinum samala]|uniref:Isoflavone reductase-like protein P3 n=1 Tax=Cladorrhinum samala TaxID=585594 RepID=A0AAV9H9R1_9PEZI|nr:isoflavone reductase-like protein P3 [Cladorrhinum samala]
MTDRAHHSILLLGKGELGTAILSSLLSHHSSSPSATETKITILCRNPPDSPPLAPKDQRPVSYQQADITSATVDELAEIFNSHDTVIQASGFGFPPGTHIKIASAALSAPNVRHFIPWQFGVDYGAIGKGSGHKELFDEFLQVRDLLRAQTHTKWTVVSSGLFMSFLFGVKEFGAVDLKAGVVRGLGGWDNKVTLTDVEGIGRMVGEVVLPGEHGQAVEDAGRGGVVYIGGETVTYKQVADMVEEVLREKGWRMEVTREEIGVDEIRRRLERNSGDKMVRYQSIFGEGVGVWWEKEKTLNYRLGIPLRGVREWLVENIEGLLQ